MNRTSFHSIGSRVLGGSYTTILGVLLRILFQQIFKQLKAPVNMPNGISLNPGRSTIFLLTQAQLQQGVNPDVKEKLKRKENVVASPTQDWSRYRPSWLWKGEPLRLAKKLNCQRYRNKRITDRHICGAVTHCRPSPVF